MQSTCVAARWLQLDVSDHNGAERRRNADVHVASEAVYPILLPFVVCGVRSAILRDAEGEFRCWQLAAIGSEEYQC